MDLFDNTVILQAPGIVVFCCPADLDSRSAMTRYVIRKYGLEAIFRLRPAVGKVLILPRSLNGHWEIDFVFLFTRASSKYPLLHMIFFFCVYLT